MDALLIARIAVFYHFILEGLLVGIFSDFNPTFEVSLNVNDSRYGAALLFFYLATVLATSGASYLIKRIGSRRSTLVGAIAFGASMSLVAISKNIVFFTLSLFVFGYSEGIMDVSMNSCGVLTEIVAVKPLLGAYHGSYSIGAAIGNLIGNTLKAKTTLSPLIIFGIFGGSSLVLSLLAYKAMYSFSEEKQLTSNNNEVGTITSNNKEYESISGLEDTLSPNNNEDNTNNEETNSYSEYIRDKLSIPPGTEALSIIGFLASFGESSIVSWSNAYFSRSLESNQSSYGFVSFMICMATGRFLCDRLRLWYGRQTIFFFAGFLAFGGLMLAVSSPSLSNLIGDTSNNALAVALATVGFSFAGLGLSTLIPTCFSSAGNLPNVHSGTAIGTVAFFTYSGSIVAPYILGLISDAFNSDLRIAFLIDAILLLLITPLSLYIPKENFAAITESSNTTIKTHLLNSRFTLEDQE